MIENIPILIFLLIVHQLHYLAQSPLPLQKLAYALGMVQVEDSKRHRSGFARTTSSFDAKRRINMTGRQEGHGGSGAGGIVRRSRDSDSQRESCSSSDGESVESLDVTGMLLSRDSLEMLESPAGCLGEGEIMKMKQIVDVDLTESVSVEEMQSDHIEVSLHESDKAVKESQCISTNVSLSGPVERGSFGPVELTEEPESKYAELPHYGPIEVEETPQSPSEEPPGRHFLTGMKKAFQEESLEEYVPLNWKIPAHARGKSKRRSLEEISPIVDRKAKLPLGPGDAQNK